MVCTETSPECSQRELLSLWVYAEVAGRTVGFEAVLKLERKWLPEIIVATVRTWRDY